MDSIWLGALGVAFFAFFIGLFAAKKEKSRRGTVGTKRLCSQMKNMTIDEFVAEIKSRPGYAEQVGMILVHNGVVRGWSRSGHKRVVAMEIYHDSQKLKSLCEEYAAREGIFAVEARAVDGVHKPGEDVLWLVVAGDLRENVISVFSEFLNRVKAEAVSKREIYVG